ncbi:hypothetical protein D4100_17540 [Serratia inhibens]|uniref:Uncharacterized protein n=1 Tax=Serratia inhibens TaxID=2338073 RepID=A0AA93BV44_9GAMM|nr:hypothetical protein D4100_17540 [Serratia inhibens]
MPKAKATDIEPMMAAKPSAMPLKKLELAAGELTFSAVWLCMCCSDRRVYRTSIVYAQNITRE